jgi:hypothetical protein
LGWRSRCFCRTSYLPFKSTTLTTLTNHTRAHTNHGAPYDAAAALEEDANWAVERATSLPELWALVAENGDGLVDAWRLMSVCRASRTGVKEWLGTLPGLVVCGGRSTGGPVRDVWRLDLATLRWEPMPALVTARYSHACCAVRGTLVVFGGRTSGEGSPISLEVEICGATLRQSDYGGGCTAVECSWTQAQTTQTGAAISSLEGRLKAPGWLVSTL